MRRKVEISESTALKTAECASVFQKLDTMAILTINVFSFFVVMVSFFHCSKYPNIAILGLAHLHIPLRHVESPLNMTGSG